MKDWLRGDYLHFFDHCDWSRSECRASPSWNNDITLFIDLLCVLKLTQAVDVSEAERRLGVRSGPDPLCSEPLQLLLSSPLLQLCLLLFRKGHRFSPSFRTPVSSSPLGVFPTPSYNSQLVCVPRAVRACSSRCLCHGFFLARLFPLLGVFEILGADPSPHGFVRSFSCCERFQ